MENWIKKILRDKYGLFEKDIEILLEKFTKFSVPKREIILQEGQTDHYIYFVEKGNGCSHSTSYIMVGINKK